MLPAVDQPTTAPTMQPTTQPQPTTNVPSHLPILPNDRRPRIHIRMIDCTFSIRYAGGAGQEAALEIAGKSSLIGGQPIGEGGQSGVVGGSIADATNGKYFETSIAIEDTGIFALFPDTNYSAVGSSGVILRHFVLWGGAVRIRRTNILALVSAVGAGSFAIRIETPMASRSLFSIEGGTTATATARGIGGSAVGVFLTATIVGSTLRIADGSAVAAILLSSNTNAMGAFALFIVSSPVEGSSLLICNGSRVSATAGSEGDEKGGQTGGNAAAEGGSSSLSATAYAITTTSVFRNSTFSVSGGSAIVATNGHRGDSARASVFCIFSTTYLDSVVDVEDSMLSATGVKLYLISLTDSVVTVTGGTCAAEAFGNLSDVESLSSAVAPEASIVALSSSQLAGSTVRFSKVTLTVNLTTDKSVLSGGKSGIDVSVLRCAAAEGLSSSSVVADESNIVFDDCSVRASGSASDTEEGATSAVRLIALMDGCLVKNRSRLAFYGSTINVQNAFGPVRVVGGAHNASGSSSASHSTDVAAEALSVYGGFVNNSAIIFSRCTLTFQGVTPAAVGGGAEDATTILWALSALLRKTTVDDSSTLLWHYSTFVIGGAPILGPTYAFDGVGCGASISMNTTLIADISPTDLPAALHPAALVMPSSSRQFSSSAQALLFMSAKSR